MLLNSVLLKTLLFLYVAFHSFIFQKQCDVPIQRETKTIMNKIFRKCDRITYDCVTENVGIIMKTDAIIYLVDSVLKSSYFGLSTSRTAKIASEQTAEIS